MPEITQEQFEKMKSLELEMHKLLQEKEVEKMNTLEREKFEKMKLDLLKEIKETMTPKKAVFAPKDGVVKDGEIEIKSFKEFLEMVRVSDPRIAHMKTTSVAAPESTTSAQGGYTIPYNWSKEILGSLNEEASAYAECTPVEIAVGNSIYLNKILTDITVAWSTEATEKNTTKPTLAQGTLSLRYLYAIISRTQELANGTITNWDALHKQLVAENFALELDAQVLQANANPFTGIASATRVNTVGQLGASLAFSDLTAVINAPGQLSKYKVGSKWWMTMRALDACMNIVDTTGRPIWNLNAPTDGRPSTLLGYPYRISDQITDTISAGGTTTVIFGNMKNVYKGVRPGGGISVLYNNLGVITTDGSVTYNLFQANMEAWRFEIETGILVGWPQAFVKLTGVTPG
jgi:HK97 family phage major capsid protein